MALDAKPYPRIGVGSVVMKDGRLLMICRSGAHGAGSWSIPGGHLEHGETPERTAERETLEETGVTVRAIERLPYTNDFTNEWEIHYVTLFILCEYISGEPTVIEPDKCPQVGWVLSGGVMCRELFLPLAHFLDENPGILQRLAHRA